MNVLLDTHAFIWMDSDPSRLSPRVAAAIRDPATTFLLSVVSVWEMQIKIKKGKLPLRLPLGHILGEQQKNGLKLLPILLAHVFALDALPVPHADPFDRMLAAQAVAEGLELVTADPIFAQYPVKVFW